LQPFKRLTSVTLNWGYTDNSGTAFKTLFIAAGQTFAKAELVKLGVLQPFGYRRLWQIPFCAANDTKECKALTENYVRV